MDTLAPISMLIAYVVAYAATGPEHGIIYDSDNPGDTHPVIRWWREATFLGVLGVHKSGHLIHYGLSAILFVGLIGWSSPDSLLPLPGWIVGVAVSALLTYCGYLIADPVRQYYINHGAKNYEDDPQWWRIPVGLVWSIVGVILL